MFVLTAQCNVLSFVILITCYFCWMNQVTFGGMSEWLVWLDEVHNVLTFVVSTCLLNMDMKCTIINFLVHFF